MLVYFDRYVLKNSIEIISLYNHGLVGTIEEYEGKIKKIKRTIDFGKFVNTKTLADTDDQLPNDFTLIMR